MQRPIGSTGGIGERDSKGDKGIQGSAGAKDDRGERGELGVKGEKGIQGDNSDVLSVLAEHIPIQLATRYGENMCFIKYHASEDRSSVIELAGGVGTLPRGILMLNLSMVKGMKWQTCKKRLAMFF